MMEKVVTKDEKLKMERVVWCRTMARRRRDGGAGKKNFGGTIFPAQSL